MGASGGELTGGTCSNYGDTSDTKDCAPAISGDGLHVAFVTSEAIVPEDRNYGQDDGYAQACLDAIEDSAAIYSDHPDYDPEWKP